MLILIAKGSKTVLSHNYHNTYEVEGNRCAQLGNHYKVSEEVIVSSETKEIVCMRVSHNLYFHVLLPLFHMTLSTWTIVFYICGTTVLIYILFL